MRPRAACLLQIDASVFSKPMGLGKLALFLSAALVRDYLVQPGVCLSNRLLYYKIQDALRVVLCRGTENSSARRVPRRRNDPGSGRWWSRPLFPHATCTSSLE